MYKQMKKQMTLTIIIIVAICVVAIGTMAIIVSGDIYNEIGRENINNMDEYNLSHNIKAKGKINAILDYFGTDDEGYFYIVPFNEDQYIGMYVYDYMDTNAYEISEDTYAYIMGEKDSLDKYMNTKGTIYRMEDVCLEYYQDWFVESEYLGGNSIELIEEYALPYLYVVESTGKFQIIDKLLLSAGGSIIALIIMILSVAFIPGSSIKGVKKYIKNNGLMLEAVENDYMNGLKLNGKYVFGRKYVFYSTWFKNHIIGDRDVIWVYKHLQITRHSVYGIKTGTTSEHSVLVRLRNGKYIVIKSNNELHSDEIVMALSKLYPCALAGWSEELQRLSSKNYPELIRVVDERRRGQF